MTTRHEGLATTFGALGLSRPILDALAKMGVVTPTPIQALAIPHVLAGRDVLARAETGSGKTIAFAGPIAERLEASRAAVLALVLCPTRELALQVSGVIETLGAARGLRTALVVGGEKMEGQLAQLRGRAQILVGTPGRVLDLIQRKFLSLGWVETVVLDEADEMLEIGFLPDVTSILRAVPPDQRRTLLFSATFPREILEIAQRYMRDPVKVATAKDSSPPPRIRQRYALLSDIQRIPVMRRLLDRGENNCFLVFCDSREEVERVYRQLRSHNYLVYPLHGGYEQDLRTRIMARFRNREIRALIATDVAARGIDVTHVDHVVNFGVPRTLERYLHRIGRTGRAGAEGEAITLVTPRMRRDWESMIHSGRLDVQSMSLGEGDGRGERSRHTPRDDDHREHRRPQHSRPQHPRPAAPRPKQGHGGGHSGGHDARHSGGHGGDRSRDGERPAERRPVERRPPGKHERPHSREASDGRHRSRGGA